MNRYLDNLQKLNEEEGELKITNQEIKEKKEKKIEEAIGKINLEFVSLLEPFQEKIRENRIKADKLLSELETYSSFPAESIGNLLADLVTTFEGEKYVYQETTFKTKKTVHTVMDRMEVEVIKNARILIKASEHEGKYGGIFRNLERLCYNGSIIILDSDEDKLKGEISFKLFNQYSGVLEETIDYGNFDYVKEYINFVISDRIDNKKEATSKEELTELLGNFYRLNKQNISEKYEMLLSKKAAEYEKNLELTKQEHEKKLQKIFI